MVSGRDKAIIIALYLYLTWKLFTLAAIIATASLLLTIALEPAGAFLIPIAGFTVIVGTFALQGLRYALSLPYY